MNIIILSCQKKDEILLAEVSILWKSWNPQIFPVFPNLKKSENFF